ncbi:BQ5605_C048g12352 [Microbotryum silenes-dioicae]|uniref:BQ5605_C048g12352 protein n=1 Tax=Microbotryum silenes-dioicae TaxID=796604 RepID=A0A2X0MPI0_9BASI|nr:BQ5605_C048g12352 [Microbotryum silenes-dioicae]
MASSSEPLHLYPTRRATYHKSRKGASRSLNWPHPLTKAASTTSSIHADHLSRAGFYSTPTSDHPSSTTCFLCDLVVDRWCEGDEPLLLHLTRSPHCGWAILLSNMADDPNKIRKHWDWGIDGSDWPRSDKIQSARLMSFERGWPHKGAKGVPTVQQLASAGWWFRPEADEDAGDRCYCPYCTRTVEGWEAGDDAVALHQRKLGLECPFFLAERPSQLLAEDVAPVASASTTKNTGLSRSKGRQKLAAVVNEELGSEMEEVIEPIPSRSSRATKTPASIVAPTPTANREAPPPSKASTTRSTRSRKAKASTKHTPAPVEEDDRDPAPEVEEVNDSAIETEISHTMSPSVRLPPRKTRGTKAPRVIESEVEEEVAPEAEAEADEVFGNGAELDFVEDLVSTPRVMEDEEEIAPPPIKKATKVKKGSKSKRSTKSKIVELEPEVEVEPEAPEADEEIPKAVPEPIIIEEPEPDVPAVESATEPEPAPDVDVTKTAAPAPKPKKRKAKSKSSKSKSVAPQTPIVIAADPISPPRSAAPSIRAAPSLPLPALNNPFTPRPDNPFSLDAPLVPSLTPGARKLSLEAWYNHCGQTAYTALEQEMGHEMREFERRIEDGNKLFEKMIEDAKRREAVVAHQQQQQAQMQQPNVLGQAVRRMR